MASQIVQCTAGTDLGSGEAWGNVNDITNDGVPEATNFLPGINTNAGLVFGEFVGFSIPVTATLTGLVFTARRHASAAGVNDITIRLGLSGSPVGDNKADISDWPIAATVITYGSSSDLWTSGITIANLNAGDVAVFSQARSSPTMGGQIIAMNGWFLTAYYTPRTYAITVATDG